MNKYVKYIYNNTYDLSKVRKTFMGSILSTTAFTAGFAMMHPYLAVLMLPDWFYLGAFSAGTMNSTVNQIVLARDKYHVHIQRFNYLGYHREASDEIRIRDIAYLGEVRNEHLPMKYWFLPPTLNKLMSVQSSVSTEESSDKEVTRKGEFERFAKFMANNVTYLVPLDSERFEEAIITEELLDHVMNGRQKSILRYDFSLLEEEGEQLFKNTQ